MRIRDPSRAPFITLGFLSLVLAVGLGCPGDTNPRINYVTFFIEGVGYHHVPWASPSSGPGDGGCFYYETDLVGRAVLADASTDTDEQESNTYFRYSGDEDGAAANGCSGAFEAQFTYQGSRYILEGTIARPFPDMSEVDDTDPDPHATGIFASDGTVPNGGFTFWAYEYTPVAPARGFPTEPQTR